jgi:hypothetical protein
MQQREANFGISRFCLDSLTGNFEGFTNGDSWNGWACPYFERAIAQTVLEASVANGYVWSYDAERDSFVVRSADDPEDYEPEEFQGVTVEIDGEALKLYPVGAYAWIWEECE